MGQIVGISSVKEPPYSVLLALPPPSSSSSSEIRLYSPIFVAEVSAKEKSENEAFRILADYIGVFTTAQNRRNQPLAMTAPVITGPKKIEMTTPVLTTAKDYMQFVLPFEYTSIDQIPAPTNPSVVIRSIPSRVIAANRFSGSYSEPYFVEKLSELYESLLKEDVIPQTAMKNENTLLDQINWSFAQYNPPFTIPVFRRNEVWIELSEEQFSEKLKQIIEEQSKS